jgi:ribose 5-phosphate isomerase B
MYFRISLASDHAGFELKEQIKEYLNSSIQHKIEINDLGCYSNLRVDYPDFAHKVAYEIATKKSDIGILVCGSGNGISMAANKWEGIRCALCWESEISKMSRLHNDANILALPARYITLEEALKSVDEFLNTEFEGGRHKERVEKITKNF